MKNTKKNKWVEKVRNTLELGGKSDRTFLNYKSHITRFLNYYEKKYCLLTILTFYIIVST